MANIAIFRINYKSDFILTLDSDAGWLTPFCIKFWTGTPSQAYFAGYDGTTYTNCSPVEGEPSKLVVQFDDHHLPIGELKFQIGYHFTVDDFPTTIEDEVMNQASVIIEVDDAPAQVMLDLNGETAPEIEFALPAYANEQQRIANEEQRIENEQARVAAEEARVAAENARVGEFAQLKSESEAATANANAAAQLATEKAALAQQKADYAQTQGDYAKTQGDYAKSQGDIAQADHQRAESDHATATADHTQAASDHSTATADHTQAVSDHTQAAADHTQAAADHTRAESDHTRAESDHAAVEVYVDSLGAFDISAYNETGGVLAKYADLTAALGTGGANIPEAIRKGGMSVKFVQSSDNKYVQYRLIATSFSTNESDWDKYNNVSVSQNTETGHTDITINNATTPVLSVNYLLKDYSIVNDNSEGTEGKARGPVFVYRNLKKGTIVQFNISSLTKNGSCFIQFFAYKNSTRLEFISLSNDDLKEGVYYIVLSDDCTEFQIKSYCDAGVSLSASLDIVAGDLTNIDYEFKTLWDTDKKSFKISPLLVTNNNYGTILPDADNAKDNTTYELSLSASRISNLPSDYAPTEGDFLKTYCFINPTSGNPFKTQYIIERATGVPLYIRTYTDTWNNWTKIGLGEFFAIKRTVITSANISIISDANSISGNKAYQIFYNGAPSNCPSGFKFTEGQWLENYEVKNGENIYKVQRILNRNRTEVLYGRNYFNNTWSDWEGNNSIRIYPQYITGNNISTILPDANDALNGVIYKFASRVFPPNFPSWFSTPAAYTNAPDIQLFTEVINGIKHQYIIDTKTGDFLWSRTFNSTWGSWNSIQHNIIVVKDNNPGGWRFQSLYEALKFAINNDNTEIEVYDGVYDLITEMGADITGTNNGILLGHNMKVKFHAKAFVTCHYTGDDEDIMSVFSPFMCGNGDYEIDGMNLSASKVRYCIHDDMGQETNQYKHIYKNCKFYLDNSASPWVGKQCIGGGLGKNGIIEIINCIFESVGASATGEDSTPPELSYHNSSVADAQSKITVTGCYFINSGCWFGYYGASTQLTDVVVNNCSMKWAPKLIQESGSYSNINFNLMQWNNDVRS